MCGFVGLINKNGSPVDGAVIERMKDTIIHRGPDDHGTYLTQHVGLGHRRLSIIDLSEMGHQPMCNEDGSIWIVFNGEIYNYKKLNQDLIEKGHVIRSHCDTETIIHLYEEYGVDCVHHLRGMFSFAIWDGKKERLFAAVDRLRIKPFYYGQNATSFVFGSEIKTIEASHCLPMEISPESIHHYLTFQGVPVPQTIYKNIFTLPGGFRLVWSKDGFHTERYWDIPFPEMTGASREEITKTLRDKIIESVDIRLMSDVPLGAFLSGGIDSSAIVGIMSELNSSPVRTFSVGYDVGGKQYDDVYYANLVSKKYNTEHTIQRISADLIQKEFKNYIRYLDQPSSDAINSYFVSQMAAKDITVVLCGQGGDELFAGYTSFYLLLKFMQRDQSWDKLPKTLRQGIAAMFSHLPESMREQSTLRKADHFFKMYGSFINKYMRIRMELTDQEKAGLYTPDFLSKTINSPSRSIYDYYANLSETSKDTVSRISYMDLKLHLGDVLMRDVDVMSMAFTLETRVPLIDHELVEYAMSIPEEYKLQDGRTKVIFIDAIRDFLPDEVVTRPKLGFAFPLPIWLKNELRPMVEFVLSDEHIRSRGFFTPEGVNRLKSNFFGGKDNNYRKIWGLVILECWMRLAIEKDHGFFDRLDYHMNQQKR